VLARLRQTHTAIELPVIMVTVKDQSADVVEALQLGANDYLTKPVDFPVALARIRTQLGHKRAEEALQRARQEALATAHRKAEFLNHMSHEIRTPLNGLLGMSTMLLTMGLTAEQREVADILHSSAEALLPLINNVLDSAKLEAGKLTLEHVPFDVRATVEGVIEVMAERAFSKHLELVASIQRDVPPMVCGDPGRLRQILLNLVGNAIKFTERGEVVVEVAKVGETATHVQVRFAVRDTGIGIPATDLPYLFQAFAQASGATTIRTHGGTGLGLSICKQLVALMGGDIGVESTPGSR
jgi:signal transduction histidine kinase